MSTYEMRLEALRLAQDFAIESAMDGVSEGDVIQVAGKYLAFLDDARPAGAPSEIYAVADSVPENTDYLTAGKRYEVISEDGNCFSIRDDAGDKLSCLWNGCAHLGFGIWRRVTGGDA